jgi:hypothetical protein
MLLAFDKITRHSILAPVAGILLNLDARASSMEAEVKFPLEKVLGRTEGLHVDVLHYLGDFDWNKGNETS